MKNKQRTVRIGSAQRIDPIDKLAPGLRKGAKDLLTQLRARNAEIENWFQEDPVRLDSLEKDPEKVLKDLFITMRLEKVPNLKRPKVGKWNFSFKPKRTAQDSSLLLSVWKHMSASPSNTQEFDSHPFRVIRSVASNTNAGAEETERVIKAFETVLDIHHMEVDALGTFNSISGVLPMTFLGK